MPRRVLAALISLSAVAGGLASVAGAVMALGKIGPLRRRNQRPAGPRLLAFNAWLSTKRGWWTLEAFALAFGVVVRNRRGPGARLLGLRRVEVAGGECVGVRAALVWGCASTCRKALLDWIFAPLKRRNKARMKEWRSKQSALQIELAALRVKHAGDRKELERAMMLAYRRGGINPLSSCLWAMPRVLASLVTDLPTRRLPLRQDLLDWLAGIAVVVERAPRETPGRPS